MVSNCALFHYKTSLHVKRELINTDISSKALHKKIKNKNNQLLHQCEVVKK